MVSQLFRNTESETVSRARFVPAEQLAGALDAVDALRLRQLTQSSPIQRDASDEDDFAVENAAHVPFRATYAPSASAAEEQFEVKVQQARAKMAARHATEEHAVLEQLAAAATILEQAARLPSAAGGDGLPDIDAAALARGEAHAAAVRVMQDELIALHERHAQEHDALARHCEHERRLLRDAAAPMASSAQQMAPDTHFFHTPRGAHAAHAAPQTSPRERVPNPAMGGPAAGAPPSPPDGRFFPAAAVAALQFLTARSAAPGLGGQPHQPGAGSGYLSRPISPPHERLRMPTADWQHAPSWGQPGPSFVPHVLPHGIEGTVPNPYYVPPPPLPKGTLLTMAMPHIAPPVVVVAAPPPQMANEQQQPVPLPDEADPVVSLNPDAAHQAAEALHIAAMNMVTSASADAAHVSRNSEPDPLLESPSMPDVQRRPRRSKYDYLEKAPPQSPHGVVSSTADVDDDAGLSDVDLISPERRVKDAGGSTATATVGLPRLGPLPANQVAPGPPQRGSSVEVEHWEEGAPTQIDGVDFLVEAMAPPYMLPGDDSAPASVAEQQLPAFDNASAEIAPPPPQSSTSGPAVIAGVGSTTARVSVPSLEDTTLDAPRARSSVAARRVSWAPATNGPRESLQSLNEADDVPWLARDAAPVDVDSSVAARVSVTDVASLRPSGEDAQTQPPVPRVSRAPAPAPTREQMHASAQALAARAAAAARQAGIAPLRSSMSMAARPSVGVLTPANAATKVQAAQVDAPSSSVPGAASSSSSAVQPAPPRVVLPRQSVSLNQTFTAGNDGDDGGDTSGDESTLSYTEAMPAERRRRQPQAGLQPSGRSLTGVPLVTKTLPPPPPALDPELGRILALLLFRTPWSSLFRNMPAQPPVLLPDTAPADGPPLVCVGRAIQLWSVPTNLRDTEAAHVEAQCRALCALVRPGERLSKSMGLSADGTESHIRLHAFHRAGLVCVVATHAACPLRVAFGAIESAMEKFCRVFAAPVWQNVTADAQLGDPIAVDVLNASAPVKSEAQARISMSGMPFSSGDPDTGQQKQQARPEWALPPVVAPVLPGGRPPASVEDIGELMACARHGRYKEAKALLKSEALASPDGTYGVDVRDEYGNTALMVACQNGQNKIAKMCVRYGADVNAQNLRGNTPLHFAAGYGFSALADWLVRCGARLDVLNAAGRPAGMGVGQTGDF